MRKIIFLANCNSPHLDRWLDLLAMMGLEVEIWSIHDCEGKDHAYQILPAAAKRLPAILKYILAGLVIHFRKGTGVLHAHNTSGYGLTALLSGKKYVVTTYGSEIFSTSQKNGLYKRLIQAVLDRALMITSTSRQMKNALEEIYQIDPTKIHNFSLGVDTETFFSTKKRKDRPRNWVINRRMHPHYYTLETILGFIGYIEQGYAGKLVVLMGDYDKSYAQEIKIRVDFDKYKDQVKLIEDFLNRTELSHFLRDSTFSVSTPRSDQLSSSILESMACGTVPLLSNLKSYQGIMESGSCLVMTDFRVSDYEEYFIKMDKMSLEEITALSSHGLSYIKKNESSDVVKKSIAQFYHAAGLIPEIEVPE